MLQKNIESKIVYKGLMALDWSPTAQNSAAPWAGARAGAALGTLWPWRDGDPRPQPRLWFRVTVGDRALVSLESVPGSPSFLEGVCPFPERGVSPESVRPRIWALSHHEGRRREERRGGERGARLRSPGGHVKARGEPDPGWSAGGVRLLAAEAAQGVRRPRRATESWPSLGWETAASSQDPGSFCPLVPGGAEEACGPGDAVAGGRRSENRDLRALCWKRGAPGHEAPEEIRGLLWPRPHLRLRGQGRRGPRARSEAAGDFCVQGDLRGGSPGLQDLPGQAQPAVDREAPELLCVLSFSSSWGPRGRLKPARLLCPWNLPRKNSGGDCRLLLQWIVPGQASTPRPTGVSSVSRVGRQSL